MRFERLKMEKVKMRVLNRLAGLIGIVGCLFMVAGCDSVRNDQGVAFTALGWFEVTQDPATCIPTAVNENIQRSQVLQPFGDTPLLTACPDIIAVGVQNNLCCQGIRSERLMMDFFVPGALVQPPSTAVVLPGVLSPADTDQQGDGDGLGDEGPSSSLPEGFGNDNSIVYWILANPVPQSVVEWMSLNRDKLPAAPFEMIITARATGVTTAGDRQSTNRIDLGVFMYDELSFPSGVAN